ncbi:MAG: hypothetical protein KJ666_05615 [Bacteroidetes bacterium]|nr:hypothetical protein [Bacteroidota bacterium]MBU2585702.1 hypothetical protein [Bacteroidota bacterium]
MPATTRRGGLFSGGKESAFAGRCRFAIICHFDDLDKVGRREIFLF